MNWSTVLVAPISRVEGSYDVVLGKSVSPSSLGMDPGSIRGACSSTGESGTSDGREGIGRPNQPIVLTKRERIANICR